MAKLTRAERVAEMRPEYERLCAERGGVTPEDPVEFHLFYLARYWGRLAGFCAREPGYAGKFVDSDLGACVEVATTAADGVMNDSTVAASWREYQERAEAVLAGTNVTREMVEAARVAVERCAAEKGFDPWEKGGGERWGR